MARRIWSVASTLLFVLGVGGVALTLYLWLGDWPQQTRELIDHLRSSRENAARPPEPLIGMAAQRGGKSLDGSWQAVIDPYDRGTLGGIAPRAVEPGSPSDLAEFSFENGLTLDVPGDWNSQDPRLVFYQGPVWYKRSFGVGDVAGRTFLHFGAANYHTSVYLNGMLVGEHEGGFTPFNYEVSERLRPGENLLVVRVDNRKGPSDVPTALTDWHNYGGLTRPVRLLQLPETFIRNLRIDLAADGSDRLEGWVELDGPGRGPVELAIPELGVEATLTPDAAGRAPIDVAARPERWSPESPRRYRVEVRAGDDAVADEIGFRTIAVEGSEILLNGEPIFLRGISIHAEAPGGGRAQGLEDARTLLGWVRELHCNFVRLSHYPHDEAMVREAERMGLLVWEEIPVYWNVAFDEPAALLRARRQLSEIIARDHNRAAVIFWSLGNETPVGEARQHYMRALADHVRAEDPTRLTTAALVTGTEALGEFIALRYLPAFLGIRRDVWTYRTLDPLGEIVDVPALNQYFGWYYSGGVAAVLPVSSHRARRVMLDNMDRIRFDAGTDAPLVISEFGAGARAGLHAPEEALAVYSEEYQALVYRRQLEMLSKQPSVRGLAPWILMDFRSPLRLYQGVQDHWNRKGLVSPDGQRKLAFAVLRDHYRTLAAPRDTAPSG